MTQLLDPLSLSWLDYCEREHIPRNTLARRRAVLGSVGNAGTATREDLERWWAGRADLSPATRSNDLACLRSFYKWCSIWEHRDDDPTRRLAAPKVPKGLPRPLSRAELNQALRAMPPDLRRALALGAYAGLRVSEAAALDWADVDLETKRLRVTGKGGKTRLVALPALLLDELLPNTGGNVIAAGGDPYSAAQLQRRINRAIRAAGVDATFHQARHRFGTVALTAANLLSVSRAMGHSSPATTAVYAATSDADLDLIGEAVTR